MVEEPIDEKDEIFWQYHAEAGQVCAQANGTKYEHARQVYQGPPNESRLDTRIIGTPENGESTYCKAEAAPIQSQHRSGCQ